MNESPSQVVELQELLDRSIANSGRHLTSIIEPGRRTLSAERLIAELAGICVLNIATTTAGGEPRLSAVDGHFLGGRWHFTTATGAVKARHLRTRPAISVAYTPRDGFGVWAHGRGVFLSPDTDESRMLSTHLELVYGPSEEWGEDVVFLRVDPSWMVGFSMTDKEMVEVEAAATAREQRLADARGTDTVIAAPPKES